MPDNKIPEDELKQFAHDLDIPGFVDLCRNVDMVLLEKCMKDESRPLDDLKKALEQKSKELEAQKAQLSVEKIVEITNDLVYVARQQRDLLNKIISCLNTIDHSIQRLITFEKDRYRG